MSSRLDPSDLTLLQALAVRYPTADLALAEAAALRASLSLPKGTVHVVSDVHGEYKKLRHIINNASGSLRPLVEKLFAGESDAAETAQLLAVIYYPHEAIEHLRPTLADDSRRREFVTRTLRRQFRIARARVQSPPARASRALPARASRAFRGASIRARDGARRGVRRPYDRDARAPRPRLLRRARRFPTRARPLGLGDSRRGRPRRPGAAARPSH
jgi:hypothetical protein